jgi:cell division septum initiation protein DivIVA
MQQLIDELENLIQRGIHVPASGKVLVDESALLNLATRMRDAASGMAGALPLSTGERERVLAEARVEANRILQDAKAQLDDQHVVQLARQRANEVLSEADRRAASLRADADAYVAGQLGALENRLQRVLRELQAGQRSLAQDGAQKPDDGVH